MKKNEQNGTEKNGTGTDTGTELSTGQVQDVVKRKQGKSDIGMFVNPPTEPGDNARYIREARIAFDGGMERKKLPPIDISDPEQVKQRISEYLDYCELNDKKPSPIAMAAWLGVSRDALNHWKRGEYRSETHHDIIEKAYTLMEEIWYDFMQNGRVNPASGIFLAKNMFGYRDETQVVVTPNNPLQDLNADEARKRIMDGIPDDEGTVE